MIHRSETDDPRQPRGEVEIIPPGETADARARPYVHVSHRIFIARPGPLGLVLGLLGLGALVVLGIAAFLSLFLVLLPAAGALLAAALIAALLRGQFGARR